MKHWRLVYLTIPLTILLFAVTITKNDARTAQIPTEGVGRVATAERYNSRTETAHESILVGAEIYREGDGPAPDWYRPDEPMSVEWTDPNTRQSNSNTIQRTDIGCPDWNVDTTLWGWNGHHMEVWEMDLYARITYLEFWGTSTECCEAGADSMLQLWDSGYYGDTMGGLLSAVAEDGSLVYSPYAYVWDWEYDPDGLAEIRALCEERFYQGPEWTAPFFRLWYYHPWAMDAYEIDGVFFSYFSD